MHNPRLVFILPCQGLDDFPSHLEPKEAENLLATWTSLWHPSLLKLSGCIPEWKRADSSSLDIQNALLVCPEVSEARIDQTLRERFPLNDSLFVATRGSRSDCLAILQDTMELHFPDSPAWKSEIPLLQDFFALGYAYLQNHLLTRRLRYSSNLDEPLLNEQATQAAQAALAEDHHEAEKWLQSCFDQLSQERDHYYSQTAHLLEIVLLAPTTLGERLQRQLQSSQPQNILASAGLLDQLKQQSPESFAKLSAEMREKRIAVIGGCSVDVPIPLLSNLALRRQLARGRSSYEALGLNPPQVFSTFSSGVTAELPLHLKQAGFTGSVLCDWTSASFPSGNQAKITWEAADGSGIDSIANHFLDAANPSSFLNIGSILGSQLDHHQVPTITFAHWPSRTCLAFADFQLATRRSPALGVWTHVDDYFASTQRPYHQERIVPQRFPAPITNPSDQQLRVLHRYWTHTARLDALLSLAVLQRQIASWLGRFPHSSRNNGQSDGSQEAAEIVRPAPWTMQDLQEDIERIDHWLRDIHTIDANANDPSSFDDGIATRIDRHRHQIGLDLSKALTSATTDRPDERQSSSPLKRRFLWNAYSSPRRVQLSSVPGYFQASPENRIYSSDQEPDGTSDLVVDVPSMGYVLLPEDGSKNSERTRRRSKGMASSDGVLGNEFLEAHVDPKSGRLHALYVALKRGNRLSGQLSVKVPRLHAKGHDYAQAVGSRCQVLRSNGTLGKLLVTGSFVFSDRKIGGYQLEYSLWRGSRFVEIRIQANLEDSFCQQNPDATLVWRTAWPNESAVLSTWNQGTRLSLASTRSFSPLLIEIDDADHKMYLLCGGHAKHSKIEGRFLDTVLDQETASLFQARLGFGIDLARPYQTALEWMDPPIVVESEIGKLKVAPTAWFVQSSAPNVLIHWVDSLIDQNERLVGARMMIHESSAEPTVAKIELFRAIKKADRVDITGRSLGTLSIEGEALNVTLRSNEQTLVDVLWS